MIGCDETGRFVVSSDCSYSINVWDRQVGGENNHPPIAIRTIFEPFKAKGDIGAVSLSRDGKYLLAGGGIPSEQGSQLKLWSWTVGNDFPDGRSISESLKIFTTLLCNVLQVLSRSRQD